MALYLTGGGDQDDFRNLDRVFLENLPIDSKILTIPVASDFEDYDDVLERAEDCFHHKKVTDIILCEDIDKISEADLAGYEAVFIEGGNTFQLIQAVRRSSFFKHLEKYVAGGGNIYADSAGAIVLGNHVKTAFLGEDADEDNEKLQDYRGLGLVGGWSFHCHYEEGDKEGVQDLMYETGSPVIALPEPAGIYISGNEAQVFGKDSLDVFTFTGCKTIEPMEKFNLETILEMAG